MGIFWGHLSVEEWRKICFDFWADDDNIIILHTTSLLLSYILLAYLSWQRLGSTSFTPKKN